MSGLFNGLEIGKRALATHQLWLNTIGHNIANVNTPGYTRQRVRITSTYPYDHNIGPVGTGVKATQITNMKDLFLNDQFRKENMSLGRWTTAEKTVMQIEEMFSEPNEGSLNSLLNEFWASWSDLANNQDADLNVLKNNLKVKSNLLTNAFHRLDSQLRAMQDSIDNDIRLNVENVNLLADEIASLNKQISLTELDDERANDLRDKRDLLIDQISQYVNVVAREESNGSVTVSVGGLAIVENNSTHKLGTYKAGGQSTSISQIVWKNNDIEITVLNGEIKGLLETRDQIIPRYQQALDDIAEALVTNINALHRTGYNSSGINNIDFFNSSETTAAQIRLSSLVQDDATNIAAASQPDAPGDRTIASAISDLSTSNVMSNGSITINEFYQSLIGEVGSETAKAIHLRSNYELMVAQIENSRQSVQGVSLDEEMTQMIKFQHAYDAAARVITTMDEALETVIKGMGIVGR